MGKFSIIFPIDNPRNLCYNRKSRTDSSRQYLSLNENRGGCILRVGIQLFYVMEEDYVYTHNHRSF